MEPHQPDDPFDEHEEPITPEEAVVALEAAVAAYVQAIIAEASPEITTPPIVTEFVLSFAYRGWSERGEDVFGNGSIPSRSATPHGIAGLLTCALWDTRSIHDEQSDG